MISVIPAKPPVPVAASQTFPIAYPLITKSVGTNRNDLVSVHGISAGPCSIEFTMPDASDICEVGIKTAGAAFWSGSDWSFNDMDFMFYQASGDSRCYVAGTPSEVNASNILDGDTIKITRDSGDSWEMFINDVKKGPGSTYTLAGAVDLHLGLITQGAVLESITIDGVGGDYDFNDGITETPYSETITVGGGGAPSSWTGSETITIDSYINGKPDIVIPQANGASRHYVYLNDEEIASFDAAVTNFTITNAENGDEVTIEAKGTDGVLTTNGPTLILSGIS